MHTSTLYVTPPMLWQWLRDTHDTRAQMYVHVSSWPSAVKSTVLVYCSIHEYPAVRACTLVQYYVYCSSKYPPVFRLESLNSIRTNGWIMMRFASVKS